MTERSERLHRRQAPQRSAAWFAIIVGLAVVGLWIMLLMTGQAIELQTAPRQMALHLAAEGLMALALMVGGVRCLAGQRWGRTLTLVGLGMMLYSVVASAGYYLQAGQWPMVAMFAALFVGGVLAVRAMRSATRGHSREA